MMRKSIFIDRDGTLIKDIPYNSDSALVKLEYYAGEMLYECKRRNYLLIVISNQSGVAKGLVTIENLYKVQAEIRRQLLMYHVQLDGFYYCPHFPDAVIEEYNMDCECRKPRPGLLFKAARDFNIDLSASWMIGDILNDVEAGNLAGCKTILIDNGNETEWVYNNNRVPNFKVHDLKEALKTILKHELERV
jgi:D-glycero-D-manno-heptose 1,7-bisphosphate phosphatase